MTNKPPREKEILLKEFNLTVKEKDHQEVCQEWQQEMQWEQDKHPCLFVIIR